jgi:two-component system sensor histidine kinase AlgZ
MDLWVPSLILQPLVENAVVHGLAGHQGPVRVCVTVEKTQEALVLRVSNTIAADQPRGADGIGLANVRERLAVQFEGCAQLAAGAVGNEWISEITFPQIHAPRERRSASHAGTTAPASPFAGVR